MSRYLVDTNLLVRLTSPSDPSRPLAANAITKLFADGHSLCICAQVLIEFRTVATRPVDINGLGMTSDESIREIHRQLDTFDWIDESPHVFATWRKLIESSHTLARQNYDARLMAVASTS